MNKLFSWRMAYSPKNRPAEMIRSLEPKEIREMKKKRFTEEQVIGILRQAEPGEQTSGEICRTHGVWESFYRWGQKYGGGRMGQAKLDNCYVFRMLQVFITFRYGDDNGNKES
jgi:hypothetical protein